MRVALYLRRSTDEKMQPESLAIQEQRLRAFAAARRDTVVEVFADSASGVTTKGRHDFARLIHTVEKGAPFEAVIVRDVSRWGRFENVDESAYWEFVCVAHGVDVIYAEELFSDAPRPYDALLKTLRRTFAAEASREKSRLVQAAKASAVSRGFRVGRAPYGMRKVAIDETVVRSRHLLFKIEPADDDHAKVVIRIFRYWLEEKLSTSAIAGRLNRDGVPSPAGRRWYSKTVTHVLTNAAYAGIAEATFEPSDNFRERVTITFENAWTPLVPRQWFDAARAKFSTPSRSSEKPEQDLAAALQRWRWRGDIDATIAACRTKRSVLLGATCREAIEKENPNALAPLDDVLRSYGVVDSSSLVVPNDTFELQQVFSLPRVRRGRVAWEFRLPTDGTADGYVLVGLTPPPDVRIVQMFFVLGWRLKKRNRTMWVGLSARSFVKSNGVTIEKLRWLISHYLYATPRAERAFLSAISGATVVSAAAIARQLGWPEDVGHAIYSRLRERGVMLPQLAWSASKTVTVICENCRVEMLRTIRGAMRTKHELCKICAVREYNDRHRTTSRCVVCGADRSLSRSYKTSPERPNDKCRRCAGRSNIIAAKRGAIRMADLKREGYRSIAAQIEKDYPDRRRVFVLRPSTSQQLFISFAVPQTRRKAYIRLRIARTDTAALLVNGAACVRKRVARDIVRFGRSRTACSRAAAQTIFIDDVVLERKQSA